jgi:hypothetical protein
LTERQCPTCGRAVEDARTKLCDACGGALVDATNRASRPARVWRAAKTVVKLVVGLFLALLAFGLFTGGLVEGSLTLVAWALLPTFLVVDMFMTSRRRWSIGFWNRILVGMGLTALIIGAAMWDQRRVRGEVSAEQLCNEVITSPDDAVRRYDGDLWIISGDVVQVSASEVALNSGPAPGESSAGCHRDIDGNVDRTTVASYSRDLALEGWVTGGHAVPDVGSTVRVVCRIKVKGFGFYPFSQRDPWVSLSDCRPA